MSVLPSLWHHFKSNLKEYIRVVVLSDNAREVNLLLQARRTRCATSLGGCQGSQRWCLYAECTVALYTVNFTQHYEIHWSIMMDLLFDNSVSEIGQGEVNEGVAW